MDQTCSTTTTNLFIADKLDLVQPSLAPCQLA
jgi:hypothetical protein